MSLTWKLPGGKVFVSLSKFREPMAATVSATANKPVKRDKWAHKWVTILFIIWYDMTFHSGMHVNVNGIAIASMQGTLPPATMRYDAMRSRVKLFNEKLLSSRAKTTAPCIDCTTWLSSGDGGGCVRLACNEVIKTKTFAMSHSNLNDLCGTSCSAALIHRPTQWMGNNSIKRRRGRRWRQRWTPAYFEYFESLGKWEIYCFSTEF